MTLEKRAIKLAGQLIAKGWRVSRAYEAGPASAGHCAAYFFTEDKEYRVAAVSHDEALWLASTKVIAHEYDGKIV